MYTDYLDQPIQVGDRIVYAQARYGGGAELKVAEIVKLIPLIPHRDRGQRYSAGDGSYMREDQQTKASPTSFSNRLYEDPTKRFVVQIEKDRRVGYGGDERRQKYTIPYSNSIIKVPS